MSILESPSLSNSLVRSLQAKIERGELLPGDILPSHQELAAQYGIGLSTVREAIKGLAMIGLVDVRSGRGTRVLPDALRVLNSAPAVQASVGKVQVQEIYEARAPIETALVRLAAERATEQDIREITAAIVDMSVNLEDNEAFIRADWRFHLAVAQAANNSILAQFYRLTHSLLDTFLRKTTLVPGEKERGLRLQEEMLDAIAEHDAERAEECARRHMQAFASALMRDGEQLTNRD